MNDLIINYLKGNTRIVVTHELQYLKYMPNTHQNLLYIVYTKYYILKINIKILIKQ